MYLKLKAIIGEFFWQDGSLEENLKEHWKVPLDNCLFGDIC